MLSSNILPIFALLATSINAFPTSQHPIIRHADSDTTITPQLFAELEELARVVDVSYCVGLTGIQRPFKCLSRCDEFPNFELVTVSYCHKHMQPVS